MSLIFTGKKLRHVQLSHEVVKLKLLFNVLELEYSIILDIHSGGEHISFSRAEGV